MEKRRIVQYLMVVLLGLSIFFMIFIATMFKILILEQGEVSPQVYEEQPKEEEYQDSICECR